MGLRQMDKRKARAAGFLIFAVFFAVLQWPVLAQSGGAELPKRMEGLDKEIFLDLRDINVVDVIKFLALEGDLNIVTSKSVQGRSTLLLHSVSIRDALDIIAISNRLAYHVINEIIYVMSEDEYAQLYGQSYNDQRQIRTRKLQYAKPAHVLQALEAIMSAIGKVIIDEETGTVVMIDTYAKLEEMGAIIDSIETKIQTTVYPLQYADAAEVETKLKERLDAKAVGSVTADPRSNQLVISAYPERLQEIVPVIQSLDKAVRAVLVDVKILQVEINPKFDYGIEWTKVFRGTESNRFNILKNTSFDGNFPVNATNISNASSNVLTMTVGDAEDDDLVFEIKALKQVLSTKLLANPRIMILDRQESKINIGDRIPYVITTTTGTGNSTSVSEEIKFIETGLILNVKPVINDDGFVTLTIRPEIASKTGEVSTPSTNVIPIVNTTFLDSTVIVKDGVTVVIGGLRRDDLILDNKGVPLLMDVPLIGNLFKSRAESIKKTEIVIFLTPKIVTGADPVLPNEPIDIKERPLEELRKVRHEG